MAKPASGPTHHPVVPRGLRSHFGPSGSEWRQLVAVTEELRLMVLGKKPGSSTLLPCHDSIWTVGLYGRKHAHGRSGQITQLVYVPRAWGDWRPCKFGERKQQWLAREDERQSEWLRGLESGSGQSPRGGRANAISRCQARLQTLAEIRSGEKDAKLLSLEEFVRWTRTLFDEEASLLHALQEVLSDLKSAPGVVAEMVSESERRIHVGPNAPHWAEKAARAARGYAEAIRLRRINEMDAALRTVQAAATSAAEARAGMWASAKSRRAAPTKETKAHARYRVLFELHAQEHKRNAAISQRSSRFSYDDLLDEVAARYMREHGGELVSGTTVERALRWVRENNNVPPSRAR